jgi:hypothetical protein
MSESLYQTRNIEVSFQPLCEGGPLFDDVYRLLREQGFRYNGNVEQLFSPKNGRILQADAIFCRQSRQRLRMSKVDKMTC